MNGEGYNRGHMRSDKNKRVKGTPGFSKFTRFWSIIYLLAAGAFVWMLYYSNMLPNKYLYAATGVVALLTALTFPGLFFYRFKKSRRVICLVLSLLFIAGYGAGLYYLDGTLNFVSKVTSISVQTEDYYVVVKKDSTAKSEDDIKGQTVGTYLTNELNYSTAKNELQKDEDVKYDMSDSLSVLSGGLLNGKYKSIFISKGHFTTMCEQSNEFQSGSRILYTVKVKLDDKDITKQVDVTKQPFNIYVSGLDTEGTIDVTSRSDVNMIVTVNPKTHTVLLTSIPRDYQIHLKSKGGASDKLTHTGLYGVNETVNSVEELMGIDINYYLKVNYTTVVGLVNAIGGIDVNSDYTFTTSGMSTIYTFYEGKNHLDGSMALAFARERHAFADGDLQRNKDQQKVMAAVIKKATSSKTILTKYSSILGAVEDNMETNLSGNEIKSLVKMQLSDMSGWKIRKQDLVGTGTLTQCYSTGDYEVYVMEPDQTSIISAVDKIVGVMEGTNK